MPSSLRAARENKKGMFSAFIRKWFPFLFDIRSTFYFWLFVFLIGIAWGAVGLFSNGFTNFYNFDYVWQFVPFAYDAYDSWHVFFSSGQFPLYKASVYLGVDNIGSNSYYGLFDPFIFWMNLFPRNCIPQLFAIATFAKFAFTAVFMRMFLMKLGIKDTTARFGAVALAFSGYMNFMVAFPTTVSSLVYVPLILYGIERVIQDKKPGALIAGLFFEGITSFFFLVVLCIWGVIYALWRFFFTIKKRDKKDNLTVMVMGVAAFGIGLAMASFSVLPSLRQSSLSGRTSSIGASYIHTVINSIKSFDLKTWFSFIFQTVGVNPGRELMGLVSFFYPTFGFQSLPITWTGTVDGSFMNIGYDAYTASIFCYTPFVILFFAAIITSIRKKKWNHLIAIALCSYLLFTNFAYFFFYAFTGNGYGRWFMVLLPEIIYYGCWAFDNREDSPKWVGFAAVGLALVATALTYGITVWTLEGKTINFPEGYNEGGYYQHRYYPPSFDTFIILDRIVDSSGNVTGLIKFPTILFVFVQLGLVLAEGIIYAVYRNKKWISTAMMSFIVVEAIAIGNFSYTFNWNYYSWFGGQEHIKTSTEVMNAIRGQDDSFYRTISDTSNGAETFQNVTNYNFTSTFHSLMNFDVEDFALNNRMKGGWDTKYGFSSEKIRNPQWSGYYGNKRYGTDNALGFRYYVNESYWTAKDFINTNAPFFTEEVESLSPNRNELRVYKVKDENYLGLGHAVDSNRLYYLVHSSTDEYEKTNFYSGSNMGYRTFAELLKVQDIELNGAMIDENVIIPGFEIKNEEIPQSLYEPYLWRYGDGQNAFTNWIYTTAGDDMLFPSSSSSYANEGLPYFLNHYVNKKKGSAVDYLARDYDHMVFTPSTQTYFCDDTKGSYFEICFSAGSASGDISNVPRVYLIGNKVDEEGRIGEKEELLSFDFKTMSNAKNAGGRYFSGYSSSFGFYAKDALVKYVVFCYEDSLGANVRFSSDSTAMYVRSYSDLLAENQQLKAKSLQNVHYDVNSFTFNTSFDKEEIVVTTLGYDAGWKAKAYLEDGRKVDCQMLKLDGGLVGFVAPKGNVRYSLSYVTPRLGVAVALGMIGFASYLGYTAYSFFSLAKRKKEESGSLEN